jgi:hypothetical protein
MNDWESRELYRWKCRGREVKGLVEYVNSVLFHVLAENEK